MRGERGRLHADVHAGDRAFVIAFELWVFDPQGRPNEECVEQFVDVCRVAIGVVVVHRLFAEHVDGERDAARPGRLDLLHRVLGIGTGDELMRHPHDPLPGGNRRQLLAEGDRPGRRQRRLQRPRRVRTEQVLVEVAEHVVVTRRREDVDKPEELRLELGVRHRGAHQLLVPPRRRHHVAKASLRLLVEVCCERADLGFQITRHGVHGRAFSAARGCPDCGDWGRVLCRLAFLGRSAVALVRDVDRGRVPGGENSPL